MKAKKTFTATAVIRKVKGGYTAWIEEMPNVISQGKTAKEARENVTDALELMLETNRSMSFKDSVGEVQRSEISILTPTM